MRDWMKAEGVQKQWEKYKYAVLVVLIGAGLLLWPSGGGDTKAKEVPEGERTLQAEMAESLGKLNGGGAGGGRRRGGGGIWRASEGKRRKEPGGRGRIRSNQRRI